MPPNEPAAGARARLRGVRSQLLLLLLPCVAVVMGFDSWSNYHALKATLESSYDEALLEPILTLAGSVLPAPGAGFVVAPGFATGALQGQGIRLHVGLVPLGPQEDKGAGAEQTLLGPPDIPAPPPEARARTVLPAGAGAGASQLTLYNATYLDAPVRIALLQRDVRDAAGRRYLLRAQAVESTARRDSVLSAALRRALWQDARRLALTVVVVWLGIARSLRPLRRLQASVMARDIDDLRPLDASGVPVEVLPLVEAVNHHLARERELVASQRRFLADVAHQVRTPLAIMMTQAGYALREPDPARVHETLRAIVGQLDRSRRLSNQLLSLADAGRPADSARARERTDLAALAQELVLEYLPLAREKDQDLGWSEPPIPHAQRTSGAGPVWVAAPAVELHEALANLVHNAIRHTPSGGAITLSAFSVGAVAIAQVSDDGPGIAPERREQVFERFHTTAGTTGAGLGLAIARAYARRNGGTIVLRDGGHPAGPARPGVCASLELPLAAAPEG